MEIDSEITVAFTGHRRYKDECAGDLEAVIRELYRRGYRVFLSGMAVGFDTAAAGVVLSLRQELSMLKLVCVVPFSGHGGTFPTADRQRFAEISAAADATLILASSYSPGVYHKRNDFLVDNSSVVIAYCDGHRSGTKYTVDRAKRGGKEIINLYQDIQQTFDFE